MPKEIIDLERQGGVYVPISKPKQFLVKQNPKPPGQSPLDILDGMASILTQAAKVKRRYRL